VDLLVEDRNVPKEQNNENAKEMSKEEFYRYYHGPKEEGLQQTEVKEQSGQLFDLQTLLNQRQDRL
jgi:hypothetical protein